MSCGLLKVEDWDTLARKAHFRPAQVAVLSGRSLRQLQRFFRARFQKTPRAWLRLLQCRLARELLVRGHSIKEIVAELHFADQAQFCHEFKRIYQVSPGSYLIWSNGLRKLSLPDKSDAPRQQTSLPDKRLTLP
jgi:AraC-like DNA-binding protein